MWFLVENLVSKPSKRGKYSLNEASSVLALSGYSSTARLKKLLSLKALKGEPEQIYKIVLIYNPYIDPMKCISIKPPSPRILQPMVQ